MVAYGDKRLSIAAVRGRPPGERVMVLVRPETVELGPANGDGTGVLTGEIVSHTFLGANMRLKITADESELTADVPASRADAYPVGMRVQARFPGETARVLTPRRADRSSSGRSLKIPSTPSAASSRIRASSLTV